MLHEHRVLTTTQITAARVRHHPRRHRPDDHPVPATGPSTGSGPWPPPGPRRCTSSSTTPAPPCSPPRTASPPPSWATAATAPSRSPCPPGSATPPAPTGSSPPWPPPPAPAAGTPRLECWWSERRCAAIWGDLARPDGYGRWREQPPGARAVTADFFLEYDTGTEDLPRLVAKLAGLPGPGRPHRHRHPRAVLAPHPPPRGRAARPPGRAAPARHPRRRLGRAIPGVPVATATPGTSPGGPAGPAWLPAGGAGPRLRLAQLAAADAPSPVRSRSPAALPAAPARRPGLVPARPCPARLARPARRAPHLGGQR